ncbi:ornithine decarboxylase antizyme-domain-containing protein [Aspergillus karnatakaensis]|uniref:ornithine decarboxylase antizyme n=1 Tax=Aspergillus karnatakaensis TaxID=1810916 RepID=UPI003CCD1959
MAFITALRAGPEYSGIPEVPSGSKTAQTSPPPDFSVASAVRSGYPVNNLLEHKGEATHTIPGECERLFCDTLSTIFLGERRLLRQQLLGIGASRSQPNEPGYGETQIQRWVEVLDYTSDAIYRGFVTNASGEQTLFVFLTENALGHGLKSGLIALFELASVQAFDCSQIVACVPRSQGGTELELTRNLGWCGFGLTTLHPWATGNRSSMTVSTRWLFLSAEV